MVNSHYLRARETCSVEDGRTFGVGIEPFQDGSKRCLLFFTANEYVVSYSEVEIQEESVYLCLLMNGLHH